MTHAPLELIAKQDGEATLLLAPALGLFTEAPKVGQVLVGGQTAGRLLVLGRSRRLIVPEGLSGTVEGPLFELVEAPVGYGTPLLRLSPLAASGAASTSTRAAPSTAGLFVRAPHAGRVWLRPSPTEAPLVAVGQVIEAGQALGLIEVMKTFAQVHYRAVGGLPERARIERILVADGAEIDDKAALFEVVPA